MGISAYYSMMVPGAKLKVAVKEDGTSSLASETGNAVADVQAETLSSDNIADFTNLMVQKQENMPNVYLDGAPFIRFTEAVSDPEVAPVTFAFADYKIDLRGDEEDVYFPPRLWKALARPGSIRRSFFSPPTWPNTLSARCVWICWSAMGRNGGGSVDVALGILSLWLDQREITLDNVREGRCEPFGTKSTAI